MPKSTRTTGNQKDNEARVYAELCNLAEALFHHVPEDQWDDLAPFTSPYARAAASKMISIMASTPFGALALMGIEFY